MDKRLKITEIAARTQLSISTVSRVLAGKANTSEKARARVLACAREQGLECSGDSAEITWIDSGFTDDQEKYVTELQIPVVSRTSGGYTESIGKDF